MPARQSSPASASNPVAPKRLRLHESNLLRGLESNRAPMPDSTDDAGPDSVNTQAARELRLCRVAAGLTQEQLAERAGIDVKTVRLRESNRVDLGPLKQMVLLQRAAKEKGAK